MGWIGLIRWIMNIYIVSPWKDNSLHCTFPQRTLEPQIGHHHFTCDKVGPEKKLIKLNQIEGLMHMYHVVLGPAQAMYKAGLNPECPRSQEVVASVLKYIFLKANFFFSFHAPRYNKALQYIE